MTVPTATLILWFCSRSPGAEKGDVKPQTFGRPLGRNEDCNPSRFAVRSCHGVSPNGEPRTTDRRNDSK